MPRQIRIACLIILAGSVLVAGCAMQPAGTQFPGATAGPANKLEAARSAREAGNNSAAWKAVASLDIADLPENQRLDAAELKANIALANHRPRVALKALGAAPRPKSNDDKARVLALKSRALFADGVPKRGLHLMIERERLFSSGDDIFANNQLLWSLISATQPLPSTAGLSHEAVGWVALARIEQTAWEEPGKFNQRIRDWSAKWSAHPANGALLNQIMAKEQARWQYPPEVALLLPLSGTYVKQAQAVEAGLLAAYYRSAQPRPKIAIYDTKGSAAGARAALASARADSAGFIVGPLTPGAVNGLARENPAMPVLALNYLNKDIEAPARFYQFGLSPAQEARSVAERAISQGLARAVVLVPSNGWGKRIANAFTRRLRELGGQVLASAEFRPGAVKFGAQLQSLLGVGASQAREQALVQTVGQPLAFTPRRRRDIQFIFFAASFTTARLLAPQIDYYHGMGLPVYSVSNVYQVDKSSAGLDGVHFPIMPWFVVADGPVERLREKLAGLFPQEWRHYASLYALGYDAWRLVPLLANNAKPLEQPVRGVTGTLDMAPGNVIRRRGVWAHYVGGHIQAANAQTTHAAQAER